MSSLNVLKVDIVELSALEKIIQINHWLALYNSNAK